MVEMR